MRLALFVHPHFHAKFFLWPTLVSNRTNSNVYSLVSTGSRIRQIAPPMLPIYDQPICPGDGYMWTPGYWAWDNEYYWVSGDWVMPPEIGYLWTPGYWGWGGNGFMFNEGYWGLSMGFYGGVNYGFGYFGSGYDGGRWDHGHFFYNSTLNNINRNSIHNVYDTRVNEPRGANRISYNGGQGGISARANSQEEAASHDRHIAPVAAQDQHAQTARNDPQQRFSANHGSPPVPPGIAPILRFTQRNCPPSNTPQSPIRAMRSKTKNIKSSKISLSPSRIKSARNSKGSRIANIRKWPSSRPMKPDCSSRNNGINSRPNRCSKGICSSRRT